MKHEGLKDLTNEFSKVWALLEAARDPQVITTAKGNKGVAFARFVTRGTRKGQKVVRINNVDNTTKNARIYEC